MLTAGAGGTKAAGGATGAGDALPTGDSAQPSADAVPVCIYAESGAEHIITVSRDVARTTYYLVSNPSQGIIARAIGTPDERVFVDHIANYEYLYAQTLPGGLLQFVDATNSFDEVCRDQGPASSFSSTCSQDGVQITQLFKDAALYVLFNRPDGSVYHGDIADWWTLGDSVISFYTSASGTAIDALADKTPKGVQTVTVSSNADGTRAISFVDLDSRLVTIDMSSYSVILAISTTQP